MTVDLARPEDEEELKRFFEALPLKGPIDFKVLRPSNYFDQYRLQTDDFDTYILRDDDGLIQGTATLLFREGQLGGKPATIGYATDLRISPKRSAILAWAQHFLPITQASLKKRNAEFLFSVLSDVDPTIQNTLIRPRAQRRNIPLYHLLRRFEMIGIVGHLPFVYDRLDTIRLSRATQEDIAPLAAYLKRKTEGCTLAFSYSLEFLLDRFKRWPGFRADSFILAKDKRGNIVGTCAPWNPRTVQTLIPVDFHGFAETAKLALKVGAFFNLTSRLPELGHELEIEYLTHLHADNPDIFGCLLEEAYRCRSPQALMLYCHFYNHPQSLPPKQFLNAKIPSALYTVVPEEMELPKELLHSPLTHPPELELCLI